MKIVLDTNVFISGIFFGGHPYRILDAWHNKKVDIVLSEEIFDEYQRVTEELSKHFKNKAASRLLILLTLNAIWVETPQLPFNISADPDDDKFFSCALASRTKVIVSGDKHLLTVSRYRKIEVLKPKIFIERYLK